MTRTKLTRGNKLYLIACAVLMLLVVTGLEARRDQSQQFYPVNSVNPQASTATKTGSAVDLAGYHAATVVFNVGLYTDGAHTLDVEDSPNNSDWTDVASTYLVGTEAVVDSTLEDNTSYWVGYTGLQRYLRANVAVAGSPATGCVYGTTVIRGMPRSGPTQ